MAMVAAYRRAYGSSWSAWSKDLTVNMSLHETVWYYVIIIALQYVCNCYMSSPCVDSVLLGWWFGLAVTRWSRSAKLLHARVVNTGMGDCLRAGTPSRYVTSHLGRLSLLPSVGR